MHVTFLSSGLRYFWRTNQNNQNHEKSNTFLFSINTTLNVILRKAGRR